MLMQIKKKYWNQINKMSSQTDGNKQPTTWEGTKNNRIFLEFLLIRSISPDIYDWVKISVAI